MVFLVLPGWYSKSCDMYKLIEVLITKVHLWSSELESSKHGISSFEKLPSSRNPDSG